MTLISQMQNIRQFAQTQLTDVIDPARNLREDDTKRSTGDHAFAVIRTPFNTYNVSCSSAYIDPPAGAPLACKSLGTVTFIERATGKQIVGPKADQTWSEISAVIHKSELRDAIADARRHIAEAAPHELAGANAKLAELAGKAKKWGIEVRVDAQAAAPAMIVTKELAAEIEAHPEWAPPGEIISHLRERMPAPRGPNAIAPHIGAPVIWITNPGEGIGGMTEIPGICVKVLSPDRIAMFVMPDHSEPKYMDNLMRRGSPAGNGNVHRSNCWDYNPHWLAERERVAALEEEVKLLRYQKEAGDRGDTAFMNELSQRITKLEGAVIALEAAAREKPRRGRPPGSGKHDPSTGAHEMEAAPAPEAAEIEGAELASELDPADSAHPAAKEADQAA